MLILKTVAKKSKSWCQVAAETMISGSLIVGVDLAPIKPIPRTITFQGDIATDKCRSGIRSHLKTWKADTVLHDGAPNVGTAWVQDAFSQAELVLQAMKLATEFLCFGGTFVTKVFRSKDYNALLWVFNQLFAKVEATKPPSSRNVSAEIFVVCRGFKAPKRIDPQFLDPRHVFAELSGPTPNNEAKVFNPERKKRKREGYTDGEYIQFKEAPASEFIHTTDPIAMLGSLNKFSLEQSMNGDVTLVALNKLSETTSEIRECCKDLKLLGRKDFRMLLRWRIKVREIFGFPSRKTESKEAGSEELVQIESMDDELKLQEELQRLGERESSKRKRERRRDNERKQREITRMQMHMLPPTDIGLEQAGPKGEDSMFALSAVRKIDASDHVHGAQMSFQPLVNGIESASMDFESNEEADELDQELDDLYAQYLERKLDSDMKYKSKRSRTEFDDGKWSGISACEYKEDQQSSDESVENEPSQEEWNVHESLPNMLKNATLTEKASMFFDQPIFKHMKGLEEESCNGTAADTHVSEITSETASTNPSKSNEMMRRDRSSTLLPDAMTFMPYARTSTGAFEVSKYNDVGDGQFTPGFELVRSKGDNRGTIQIEHQTSSALGKLQFLQYCLHH